MTPRKCTMPSLIVLGLLGFTVTGFDAKADPVIGELPSGATVLESATGGDLVGDPPVTISVTGIDPSKTTSFSTYGPDAGYFELKCAHSSDEIGVEPCNFIRPTGYFRTATATASIGATGGKTITGFSDLHGGSGYSDDPYVSIRDGADGRGPGRGATASAIIGVNDFTSACWVDADNPTQFDPKLGTDEEAVCWKVTKLELTNPGSGYTDPRVVIQPSYTTDHKPKFTIINSSSLGRSRTIYKVDNRAILRISSSSGYNTLSCTTVTVRKNGNVHSSHDVKIADGRIVFSVDSNDTDKDIGRWEPGLSVDTFACAPDANANNDATATVTTVSDGRGVDSITISDGGKNYFADGGAPKVTIALPWENAPESSRARAEADLGKVAGERVVTGVTVTYAGTGYTKAPEVTIAPPIGSAGQGSTETEIQLLVADHVDISDKGAYSLGVQATERGNPAKNFRNCSGHN